MGITVASRNMITELHVHCGTAPGDSDTEQAGRMGRHEAAEGDKTLKANLHDKKIIQHIYNFLAGFDAGQRKVYGVWQD